MKRLTAAIGALYRGRQLANVETWKNVGVATAALSGLLSFAAGIALSAGGMEAVLLGGVSNASFTRPIGLMLDGETTIDADYSAESGWASNTAGSAATFRVVVS